MRKSLSLRPVAEDRFRGENADFLVELTEGRGLLLFCAMFCQNQTRHAGVISGGGERRWVSWAVTTQL